MPLSNYTELKESIIKWSKRDDLDTLIPDLIKLAEFDMYNPASDEIDPLKLKELEVTTTLSTSTSSRLVNLPSDFFMLRNSRLDITNESDFFEFRSPEQMRRYDQKSRPCFFTVVGNQIELDRISDQVYTIEIQYFSKAAALTAAAPTNTVLTNYPNIYLYGALYHAFIYADQDDFAAKYQALFASAINGANNSDKQGRFGPSPVMTVEGSTP